MMKIEHLNDRIKDYNHSIETVIRKKIYWNEITKALLIKTLTAIQEKYVIGWSVQVLNWIQSNEAVNITLDSFPPHLMQQTNKIPSYQFIQGGSLVFTQVYNGNIQVVLLYPYLENTTPEDSTLDLGEFIPEDITEKLIIEKVDEFLKEIIVWEGHQTKNKLGFQK